MTAKDHGMKFDLNQKVFIKTMNNIEGIITGRFFKCEDLPWGKITNEYDVLYLDDSLGWETYYPSVREYVGPGRVTARIKEEDLAPFTTLGVRGIDGAEWVKEKGDAFDILRYISGIPVHINIQDTAEIVARKTAKAIETHCTHSWKSYQGFTQQYDYCEKCDAKK
jgi:hypothetical protein